jgi:hypothetical protein
MLAWETELRVKSRIFWVADEVSDESAEIPRVGGFTEPVLAVSVARETVTDELTV